MYKSSQKTKIKSTFKSLNLFVLRMKDILETIPDVFAGGSNIHKST